MSRRAPRVGRCSGGAEPDWTPLASGTTPSGALTAAASLLENETWTKAFTYDASSRVTSATMPDSSELLPSYNEAGLLDGVDVKIRGASTVATFVDDIDYDAHGRRTRIEYGNTTATEYFYDDLTFRLTRIRTTRSTDSKTLQDLKYTYDPVGNILEVHDDAHEDVFYNDAQVEATGQYEYDPIYRLNQATGREHSGGVGDAQRDQNDLPLWNLPHPNDAAALRRYVEEYTYDKVGNLLEFAHEGLGGPSGATWTRTYRYDTGVTSGYANNRLHSTSEPGSAWASYTHDANGNMVAMPHLATLDYTHRDQMQHADLGGGGDAYYTYDGGGERVRKFIQRTGTTTEERIYLGGWELYRKRVGTGQDIEVERETLQVMDDARRIAMVETLTVDDEDPVSPLVSRVRYQYGNHLDSAMLECDDGGDVISYEEYHPYGTAAYRSAKSGVEVSERRYRYTGKERDEETGLSYHQWRYYAPWLARWTTADPAGLAGGPSLYGYCRGVPVSHCDPDGQQDIRMPDLLQEFSRGLGRVIEFFTGGRTKTVGTGANGVVYEPSPIPYGGGVSGGIVQAATLRLWPQEPDPTPASRSGMDAGAGLVPVADPAARLVTGRTVSKAPASRLEAAAELALQLIPMGGEARVSSVIKPPTPDLGKALSDALKAGAARVAELPPEVRKFLPEAEKFVAARKPSPGGEGITNVAKPLPPAGGSSPPEGRVIVGGRRGQPGSPEPRPYPKDITVDPQGGDIRKRVQQVPETHPELVGKVPEVYFERTPPGIGLNTQALESAQQLLNQCGGPVRITTTPELAEATRAIITRSGAEIVSEGAVEVTTQVATTVGYEFVLRYK